MKKSIKKLALNKKAVCNLSEMIKGGLHQQDKQAPTTDPTANTRCFDYPPDTF